MGYDNLKEEINIVMDKLHPKNFNDLYSKDSRKKLLHLYAPVIFKWVVERGHKDRKKLDELCELMSNKKVAKTLKKLLKEYNENDYFENEDKIGVEFVVVVNEILIRLKPDDDAYPIYYDIAQELLANRIEKMVQKADISEKLAMNLLLIVPKPDVVLRDNIVGIYVNKVVRRLYSFAYTNEKYEGLPKDIKSLKQIFKILFGKSRLDEVAVSLALEKVPARNDNQGENFKRIYDLLTEFALDRLEQMDSKELKENLLLFADRRDKDRKQKRDGTRRIQFKELDKEKYPNIRKALKKVIKKHGHENLF